MTATLLFVAVANRYGLKKYIHMQPWCGREIHGAISGWSKGSVSKSCDLAVVNLVADPLS